MHDANAEVVDEEEHSDEEDLRPSFEKMKSKQATKQSVNHKSVICCHVFVALLLKPISNAKFLHNHRFPTHSLTHSLTHVITHSLTNHHHHHEPLFVCVLQLWPALSQGTRA